MKIRRTAAVVISAAALAGGLSLGFDGVAQASSSCTTGSTYVTPTSFPSHIAAHTAAAIYTHIAPESGCETTGSQLPAGYDVTVYCYSMNVYDNEWLYVGAGAGRSDGWVSASSIDYDSTGSAARCSL